MQILGLTVCCCLSAVVADNLRVKSTSSFQMDQHKQINDATYHLRVRYGINEGTGSQVVRKDNQDYIFYNGNLVATSMKKRRFS